MSTLVVALGEFGDKTQLLALLLAARFKRPVPIIAGIFAATLLNHSFAGLLGAWVRSAVSPDFLRLALGISFVAIALWALKPDKLAEHERSYGRLGIFAVTFVAFFLAEIGDKTQLADAIGFRQLRRYALTGERFGAEEARRIGLAHEVVPLAALEAAGEKVVAQLLQNAPEANAQTKAAALEFAWGGIEDAVLARLVAQHAAKRRSAEGAEGLALFVEKRAARWGAA